MEVTITSPFLVAADRFGGLSGEATVGWSDRTTVTAAVETRASSGHRCQTDRSGRSFDWKKMVSGPIPRVVGRKVGIGSGRRRASCRNTPAWRSFGAAAHSYGSGPSAGGNTEFGVPKSGAEDEVDGVLAIGCRSRAGLRDGGRERVDGQVVRAYGDVHLNVLLDEPGHRRLLIADDGIVDRAPDIASAAGRRVTLVTVAFRCPMHRVAGCLSWRTSPPRPEQVILDDQRDQDQLA